MTRHIVIACLLMLAVVPFAQAQIPVTDDTFTSSCASSTSFGSSIALIVQSPTATGSMANPPESNGCTANAYVRFDVVGAPSLRLSRPPTFEAAISQALATP